MKIIFKFDKEKDIQNWWGACNSNFMGIDWKKRVDKKIWKNITGKTYIEAKKFLEVYLGKLYKKDKKLSKFKEDLPKYWAKSQGKFVKTMEEIIGKPIYPKIITVYYTSFPRGPYDTKNFSWMQSPVGTSIKQRSSIKRYCRFIFHELMHFQFHHYYWKFARKQKLSEDQINHIKEASTVLLNKYFYPEFMTKDFGYPIHKKFRKDLLKLWSKNPTFKNFLVESAKLIKENYPELKKYRV
jgi:hypothetical protein